MEVEKEPEKERNYGRVGCIVALVILIIVVILIVTGLINIPNVT